MQGKIDDSVIYGQPNLYQLAKNLSYPAGIVNGGLFWFKSSFERDYFDTFNTIKQFASKNDWPALRENMLQHLLSNDQKVFWCNSAFNLLISEGLEKEAKEKYSKFKSSIPPFDIQPLNMDLSN